MADTTIAIVGIGHALNFVTATAVIIAGTIVVCGAAVRRS